MVETDVHYPTDTNLLFDAVRKTIHLLAIVNNGAFHLSYLTSIRLRRINVASHPVIISTAARPRRVRQENVRYSPDGVAIW